MMKNFDICSDFLSTSFNSSIKMTKFPKNYELADITTLHKKDKKDIKGNYRPASIQKYLIQVS